MNISKLVVRFCGHLLMAGVLAALATGMMVLFAACLPFAVAAEPETVSVWTDVKDLAGSAFEGAKAAWPDIKDAATDKASEALETVKEKAPIVAENVQNGVKNAQEKVADFYAEQEEEFFDRFAEQTGLAKPNEPAPSDDPQESSIAENSAATEEATAQAEPEMTDEAVLATDQVETGTTKETTSDGTTSDGTASDEITSEEIVPTTDQPTGRSEAWSPWNIFVIGLSVLSLGLAIWASVLVHTALKSRQNETKKEEF